MAMAGLLSLVQELMPMILPGSVEITRAVEIRPASPAPGEEVHEAVHEELHGEEEEANKAAMDEVVHATHSLSLSETRPPDSLDHFNPIDPLDPRDLPDPPDPSEPPGHDHDPLNSLDRHDPRSLPPQPAVRPPSRSSSLSSRPPRPSSLASLQPPRRTGVSMRDAMVHKSDRLCAVVLTVKPQCSTVIFHNAEQECVVYAVAGTAVLATLGEDYDVLDDSDLTASPPPTRDVLGPGDFVYIPAWTEHQVINESSDTDVVWVVVRTGPEPTVVPLSEWGGPQA